MSRAILHIAGYLTLTSLAPTHYITIVAPSSHYENQNYYHGFLKLLSVAGSPPLG